MQEEKEADECRSEMLKHFPHDPDLVHETKYREFRAELWQQENFMLVPFSNKSEGIPELATQFIAAIGRLAASGQLSPTSGWIRADSHDGKTLLAIEGNPFLKREMEEIQRFEVLAKRVTLNPAAKKAMAKHFWFYMQSRIRDWARHFCNQASGENEKVSLNGNSKCTGLNLFFESGSSLAYVAEEFEKAVLDKAGVREDWHIRTNNIIFYASFNLTFTPQLMGDVFRMESLILWISTAQFSLKNGVSFIENHLLSLAKNSLTLKKML